MTHRHAVALVWEVVATFAAGDLGACIAAWLLGVVLRGEWGEA